MHLNHDPQLVLDVAVRRGLLSEAQAQACRAEIAGQPDPVGWLAVRRLLAADEALLLREIVEQIKSDARITRDLVRDGFLSDDTARLLMEHELNGLTTEKLPDLRSSAAALGVHLGDELEKRAQPSRIGRYEILRELGRGGMGLVYAARDVELGREVALKVIRGALDAADVDRFRREARLMAGLHHPRIVSVFDVGEDETSPYFVMNLVSGASLASKSLPRREGIALLKSIADAVQYAHESGVLHRDIKPENILVDAEGRGYITDFGLARPIQGHESLSGAVVGTPGFMSPEQARGEASMLDARTDVWGLGATLYFVLTGHPPFVGANAFETISKVMDEEPRRPRRVDASIAPDLEAICLKALEKNREERYESAREFGKDLDRFLNGESVRAKPIAPGRWFLRKLARHRRAVTLVSMLFLLVAVASSWGIVSWTRSRTFERLRGQAEVAFRTGDWQGASLHAEEALRIREDAAMRSMAETCRHNLARAKVREQILSRAESVRATVQHVEDRLYMARVDVREDLDRTEAVLDDLERFLLSAGASDISEGWKSLGVGRYVLGDAPGAERALRRARELDPKDGVVAYYLARLCLESAAHVVMLHDPRPERSIAEARAVFRRAQEMFEAATPGPGRDADQEVLISRAYRAWAGRNYEDLKKICRQGLDRYPRSMRSEDFHLLLAYAETDCRAQVAACNRALEIRPHYALGLVFRGNVRGCTDLRGALDDYSSAIRLSPRFARAYILRGQVRNELGDRPGALEDFTEAVRRDPLDAAAYVSRGNLRAAMGDRAGAWEDYEEAIRLDPESGTGYYNRGLMKKRGGDFAGALLDYTEAIRRDPECVSSFHNRGLAYLELREFVRALMDFDAALFLNPAHVDSYFARGVAFAKMRNYARAAREYEMAIRRRPDSADLFVRRGMCRMEIGDLRGSLSDLSEALRRAPDSADTWAYRGWVRTKLGDDLGALHDLVRSVGLAPPEWRQRGKVEILIAQAGRRLAALGRRG